MGRVPKLLFRCESMEILRLVAGQTVHNLVDSTSSWTNHRSDTKLREEHLTRMQCRPSHGRSLRPSQPTLNLTLIANGRRNSCLSTGRRYKGCLGRAEFPHTRSEPAPAKDALHGGTS